MKSSQKGIGLLELMLSLAIIALLLVMATKYFGLAHRAQTLNHASKDTTFLMASIQNWRTGQDDYHDISFQSLFDEGLTPSEITEDGGLPAWDGCTEGKITIMASDSHDHLAKIMMTNISNKLCKGLHDRLNSQARDFIIDSRCTVDQDPCAATYTVVID